ncbi:hypothetical protein V3O24_12230 [Methylobacter sp. Wu8]|uniref:hypothetical protein n=1 Tax=Methylobacter sp. Wu8 TaxID=3118457 RepID=UPI002F2DF6D6
MSIDYDEKKWGKLNLKLLVIDTEHYIVFIDNEEYLDWITSKEYDSKGHKDNSKHNEVMNMVALLECKPIDHFDKKTKLDFKRLLGEAIARSLSHDYPKAEHILQHTESYIKDRGKELSRRWYLDTAGKTTAVCLLIGVYAWIFREYSIGVFGIKAFYFGLSMVAGALGALLSIIFRMGKENLDCLAGREIHEIESMYRIIAGMLSAFLGSLLVRTDLFLPVFSKANNIEMAVVLVGFIAGMSERFAPSISTKIENGKP